MKKRRILPIIAAVLAGLMVTNTAFALPYGCNYQNGVAITGGGGGANDPVYTKECPFADGLLKRRGIAETPTSQPSTCQRA